MMNIWINANSYYHTMMALNENILKNLSAAGMTPDK
jgi:hypothetical protein